MAETEKEGRGAWLHVPDLCAHLEIPTTHTTCTLRRPPQLPRPPSSSTHTSIATTAIAIRSPSFARSLRLLLPTSPAAAGTSRYPRYLTTDSYKTLTIPVCHAGDDVTSCFFPTNIEDDQVLEV